MEPSPGREPLNTGLILLFLALIAYAAIGLTLRVEPVPGNELPGPGEGTSEMGTSPWTDAPRASAAAAREPASLRMP
jgi:hypothetical protein